MVGTPALPLYNAMCIYQDVSKYKFEEPLTELTFLLQLQIDSVDSVGCSVYLRSGSHPPIGHIDEAIVELLLKAG